MKTLVQGIAKKKRNHVTETFLFKTSYIFCKDSYVRLCIGKKSCNELGQFQVGILVISVHCTYKPHYTSTLQRT